MVETILSDARAQVAAGRDPDWKELRDRVRALELGTTAEREALRQLEQVGAVQRGRRAVARPVTPPAAPAPRKPLFVTKPTISGTMDVRHTRAHVLEWTPLKTVEQWEVRISERPTVRGGRRQQTSPHDRHDRNPHHTGPSGAEPPAADRQEGRADLLAVRPTDPRHAAAPRRPPGRLRPAARAAPPPIVRSGAGRGGPIRRAPRRGGAARRRARSRRARTACGAVRHPLAGCAASRTSG